MSTTLKISNGDIDIDSVLGQAKTIDGVVKCSQDIAAVLMTDMRQSNRSGQQLPRAYGNELATLKTPLKYSGLIGKPLVSRKIQEAVQRLEDLQTKDPNITADEKIKTISKLIVEGLNSTDFIYWLEVQVSSGNTTPSISNLEAVKLDQQFSMTSGIPGTVRNQG